jgi:hypothetical protein
MTYPHVQNSHIDESSFVDDCFIQIIFMIILVFKWSPMLEIGKEEVFLTKTPRRKGKVLH